MKRQVISLFLICAMLLCLCGCGGKVGQIASSVMDAAMQELKNQVSQVLEENKLEVVELKTAFGQLNDQSKYQFFVAALIRSDSESLARSTADTLNQVFTEAGVVSQTQGEVASPYLVYKTITFNHTDFSDGNYMVIYAYHADLTASLPNINSGTVPATTQ